MEQVPSGAGLCGRAGAHTSWLSKRNATQVAVCNEVVAFALKDKAVKGCRLCNVVLQPQRGTALKLPALCLAGRQAPRPGRLANCSACTAFLTACRHEPCLDLGSRHSRQTTGPLGGLCCLPSTTSPLPAPGQHSSMAEHGFPRGNITDHWHCLCWLGTHGGQMTSSNASKVLQGCSGLSNLLECPS